MIIIKTLNNIFKGVFTALIVIILGGSLSLFIKMPPSSALILISSSVINNITTNSNTISETKSDDSLEEETEEEVIEEEIEVIEEETENTTEEIIIEEKENKSSDIVEEEKKEIVEEKKEEVVTSPNGSYAPNLEVASMYISLDTYYGKMTAYGPDCYGCRGITASGYDVRNGNIYYNDKTFGNIRVVAGDKSLAFGTIVKITGLKISSEPILAIVLDRGGAIGFAEGKHAYFDLLYVSNSEAMSFGYQTATMEILRKGY